MLTACSYGKKKNPVSINDKMKKKSALTSQVVNAPDSLFFRGSWRREGTQVDSIHDQNSSIRTKDHKMVQFFACKVGSSYHAQ